MIVVVNYVQVGRLTCSDVDTSVHAYTPARAGSNNLGTFVQGIDVISQYV
jgi:hypothetical protein